MKWTYIIREIKALKTYNQTNKQWTTTQHKINNSQSKLNVFYPSVQKQKLTRKNVALTWIAEEVKQDAGKGSIMKGKTSTVQMVNAKGGEEML